MEWPPEVAKFNEDFTRLLEGIKKRHDTVVPTVRLPSFLFFKFSINKLRQVAQGILEYKKMRGGRLVDTDIQRFLDRFYMSRIGIRFLIGQHIALNKIKQQPKDYVGIICKNTVCNVIFSYFLLYT